MKTLVKILVSIVICLALVLVVLRITGLSPQERRPGLWLKGDLVTTPVSDWSFTDQYQTLQIQTHPWYLLPHSVNAICVASNGTLYISSTYATGLPPFPHGRSWNEDVVRDPHVRLKIGDKLYDRTVALVTDQTEWAAVAASQAKKYAQLGGVGNRKWPKGSTTYYLRVMPD